MKPPMAGWIAFASIMLMIVGTITACEGLIAIVRDNYFAIHGSQLIVFDTTTWGWVTLIWGLLVTITGFCLYAGAGWARWVAIALVAVNLLGQLGWLGNSAYPLWTLVIVGLDVTVIYALTARWGGYTEQMQERRV